MRKLLIATVVLALPAWSGTAHAQLLFKKQRPTPSQRVPELILSIKTEGDERRRALAAEELRDFDTRTFSEIVPVLVDVLHRDPKVNVRLEALNSLARIRPVSQSVGQALEHAAANDESWRVRLQARSALVRYNLVGMVSGVSRSEQPSGFPTTQEPPLAEPTPAPTAKAPPANVPVPAVAFPPQTPVPATPVAGTQPPSVTPIGPSLNLPRPLPLGVAQPAAPAAPPGEGPALPDRPF